MRVSILGTGYVGLVSAACLAEKGHEVVCVDLNADKVRLVNEAKSPIHEKGLDDLLRRHVPGTLRATTDVAEAVMNTDVTLLAVGTPFGGSEIDLSQVRKASHSIGQILAKKSAYHVVVVKSTVVPGTTDDVVLPILEEASGKKAGADFGVGMNPEFLREGEAVEDFMFPDRIVIGGIDTRTLDTMAGLYASFTETEIVRTNNRTAEMIKYASNSLLATMISFSNEIGNLCAVLPNVDVLDVMKGMHLDRRMSPIMADGSRVRPQLLTYLQAGCGYGGSCFPKDVKALTAFGTRAGKPMRLLEAVTSINQDQPNRVLELLRRHFPTLRGVRVTVLGVAFKPGTDDLRESPAIPVLDGLLAEGASVRAYDPVAHNVARQEFAGKPITFSSDLPQAIENAEAVVLMTRWEELRALPDLIARSHPQPLVVDGRRMLDKDAFERYEGIGLSSSSLGRAPVVVAV